MIGKIKEIYEDVSAYHDIVSDLRDMLREVKKYPLLKENDILMGFGGFIDGFEDCIWKSMNRIDKIKEK